MGERTRVSLILWQIITSGAVAVICWVCLMLGCHEKMRRNHHINLTVSQKIKLLFHPPSRSFILSTSFRVPSFLLIFVIILLLPPSASSLSLLSLLLLFLFIIYYFYYHSFIIIVLSVFVLLLL